MKGETWIARRGSANRFVAAPGDIEVVLDRD